MHEHHHDTPATDNEIFVPRTMSKGELDSIELQVREMLDQDASEEEIRATTNSMLEAAGQLPLAENETQRVLSLEIDGETVEKTVILDSHDIGTFVSPLSEMGIEGLADEGSSHEHEKSIGDVEQGLAEVALSAAINEGVLESRLGKSPEQPDQEKTDSETKEADERAIEKAKKVFEAFGRLTDSFKRTLEIIEQSTQPDEVAYHLNALHPMMEQVTHGFPSSTTDKAVNYNLDYISSIMSDFEGRFYTMRRMLNEQGPQLYELKAYASNARHHGLMGAMIDAKRRTEEK